jgi:tape measure domain-containing protein
MSNVLEYTLSLQDQISAKLQKIGINNDMMLDKFAKLQTQTQAVSKTLNMMGTSVYSLTQKIDLLKAERDLLPLGSLASIRKYNSEINKLETQVTKLQTLNGSKVKTWFKDALNGLPALATNPLTLIGAGLGGAMKKGMENDMQKANISTLLAGDAKKAEQLFSKITQYAIKSPYEKGSLIDGQKTMMQFGVSADDSFSKLQQIGDIAMGDSEKMKSLSLAFGQVSSAGKLQGQDLLQMINAGFNPLKVISDRTGESMASLKKRMSDGKVSAEEVSKAFGMATDKQGLFYKGAEKAGETMGGKWSTLVDSFNEMLLKLYSVIAPIMLPIIKLSTSLLNGIGTGFGWLIDKFKEGNPIILGVALIVGAFTTALLLYNTYIAITTTLQSKFTLAILKTNLAFLANPIVWIISGIVALIAVIGYVIYAFDGWGAAWKHTLAGAKLLFSAFIESIKLYFMTYINGFMIGLNIIKLGWYKFKEAVGMGNSAENQSMIAKINADTEARQKAILDGAKKVKATLGKSGQEFKLAAGSIHSNGKGVGNMIADTKSKLGISPATIPGITPTGANPNGNGTGADAGTKTNQAIATGGTKNTVVNITIQEMNGVRANILQGAKESIDKAGSGLEDAILRTLAMASSAGS